MTQEEYDEALTEKARVLYCRMIGDPLPAPALDPRTKEFYPPEIRNEIQMDCWREIVEQVQIIKRSET